MGYNQKSSLRPHCVFTHDSCLRSIINMTSFKLSGTYSVPNKLTRIIAPLQLRLIIEITKNMKLFYMGQTLENVVGFTFYFFLLT